MTHITERLNKRITALQIQLEKTFESTELPSAARPFFNESQRASKMLMDEYKSCLSAIDTLSAISALFPDDAPHKHPETCVSLLDDVRDVIEDAKRYRYQYNDKRYEAERYKQHLENASHQIRHLQGMNESLLKALTEPLKTHIPPMYIMSTAPLRCIFCTFKGTLEELKDHSARCPEHPAVKALAEAYKR